MFERPLITKKLFQAKQAVAVAYHFIRESANRFSVVNFIITNNILSGTSDYVGKCVTAGEVDLNAMIKENVHSIAIRIRAIWTNCHSFLETYIFSLERFFTKIQHI